MTDSDAYYALQSPEIHTGYSPLPKGSLLLNSIFKQQLIRNLWKSLWRTQIELHQHDMQAVKNQEEVTKQDRKRSHQLHKSQLI